jgi:hypothetical protein
MLRDTLCQENDPRVAELRRRLDEFYRTTTVYDAFKATNQQPDLWMPIRREIVRLADGPAAGRKVRVLEFGAGRSGFGDFLGELRPRVEFHTQDVTPQNSEFLATQSDHVHVGDVADLAGPYDVMFSTFVWEHITNPVRTLTDLLNKLAPGGSLFLVSPRYDLVGYTPPSARHHKGLPRLGLALGLALQRLRTRLGGPSGFLIHTDPALFHGPWYRDADAIHWVSVHDLKRALPPGCSIVCPPVPGPPGLRGWVWRRFCLLFVQIRRETDGPVALRGLERSA